MDSFIFHTIFPHLMAKYYIYFLPLSLWSHIGLVKSHSLFHSAGFTAGNAGGRLCPLHQPVPWLRAANADGPPISLLLHPRNHGRIQRSVTSPLTFAVHFLALYPNNMLSQRTVAFRTPHYPRVENKFLTSGLSLLCLAQRCPGPRTNCRELPRSWISTKKWELCLWSHLLVFKFLFNSHNSHIWACYLARRRVLIS